MAVVENAGAEFGSNQNIETPLIEPSNGFAHNEKDQPMHGQLRHSSLNQNINGSIRRPQPHDQNLYGNYVPSMAQVNGGQMAAPQVVMQRSLDHSEKVGGQTLQVGPAHHQLSKCGDLQRNGDHMVGENLKREMKDLSELFPKLNPMAEEFVPSSHFNNHGFSAGVFTDSMFLHSNEKNNNGNTKENVNGRRNSQGKRRMNNRTSLAQREDRIRRTVYVSDINQQVTEEQLAALFVTCGQVIDCRICGDPTSVLRFAFIEFIDEEGAQIALNLSGTMLGFYPVKVSQAEVKLFFESVCGEVYRLRLLGDRHHYTRIAFVEFVMAESAINALNCSGVVLGSLPIRVSPSKTPVRSRGPRIPMH